ncbi:hypothetical protein E2C01_043545 [Portunus trituberculatus]|uniref:Uncharacterized protein n=1 Tax=Portunus trituberculatus TaxID=210409 RepID=A0A5B7FXL7_PORTR|nr:hypothetical protein [Portunus trituberculatus]
MYSGRQPHSHHSPAHLNITVIGFPFVATSPPPLPPLPTTVLSGRPNLMMTLSFIKRKHVHYRLAALCHNCIRHHHYHNSSQFIRLSS